MTATTATAEITIDDVKAAAAAAGSNFFTPDALIRRDSRISARVHVTADSVFFVTSEASRGERAYTVRRIDNATPGRVLTAGGFMAHASGKAAHAAAAKLAK